MESDFAADDNENSRVAFAGATRLFYDIFYINSRVTSGLRSLVTSSFFVGMVGGCALTLLCLHWAGVLAL